MKRKWTAFVLCLLLGWIGAHRFYVGKNGSGFLYLFTFGLFGLGWFWDALMILLGQFKDGRGMQLVADGAGAGAGAHGAAVDLPGVGSCQVEIVGESFYQDTLRKIGHAYASGKRQEVEARLILEGNNPKDPQAVRIDIQGKPVGYLSREYARKYRQQLATLGHPNATGRCDAIVLGGRKRENGKQTQLCVLLDLPPDWF